MKEEKDLLPLLNRFKGPKVLVLGDTVIDSFVFGEVSRLSATRPVPVLSIRHQERMLGAAVWIIRTLKALEVDPVLVTVVGKDAEGEEVRKEIKALLGPKAFVLEDPAQVTPLKTTYIAQNQSLLRTDRESGSPVSPAQEKEADEAVRKMLPDMRALLLADYRMHMLTPDIVKTCLDMAKDLGIPSVVHTETKNYELYRGADILLVKARDLEDLFGLTLRSEKDFLAAGTSLMQKYGLGHVLISMRLSALYLVTGGDGKKEIHTFRLQPTEVSSAFRMQGEIAAAVTAALAAGASPVEAAALGAAAANVIIRKTGIGVVQKDELREALLSLPKPTVGYHNRSTSKVVSMKEGLDMLAKVRTKGVSIGLLPLMFKNLTLKEVELAAFAHKRSNFVVALAVDSDPYLLAALENVDLVLSCKAGEEPDVLGRARPDVYVRGSENPETLAQEKKVLYGYGGVFLEEA